jgi:hypothetical protein
VLNRITQRPFSDSKRSCSKGGGCNPSLDYVVGEYERGVPSASPAVMLVSPAIRPSRFQIELNAGDLNESDRTHLKRKAAR